MSLPERPDIDIFDLRSALSYDPETGLLRWKSGNRKGQVAGTLKSDGYMEVVVDGVRIVAHRAAWAIHTGFWPFGIVDHDNQVRHDNRWSNLKDTTTKGNAQNRAGRGKSSYGINRTLPVRYTVGEK